MKRWSAKYFDLPISWVSKRWIASTGVTLDVRKAVGRCLRHFGASLVIDAENDTI